VGLEPLVTSLALGEPAAEAVLDLTTEVALRWIGLIRSAGFDAMVFDSSAAPPMLSPDLYRRSVRPLHARLMRLMQGQKHLPLILGGNTTSIVGDLSSTGADYLVCDFPADAARFAQACPAGVTARRNVDPRLICDPAHDLVELADALLDDVTMFEHHGLHPVAGTGVLPYDTNPRRVQALRDAIQSWRVTDDEP
jgi:uroporphyrinogen decarboxylase